MENCQVRCLFAALTPWDPHLIPPRRPHPSRPTGLRRLPRTYAASYSVRSVTILAKIHCGRSRAAA